MDLYVPWLHRPLASKESRRNQEEGGELDSHEEVRLLFIICGSRRDQEEGGELDSHEEVKTVICGSRRDQEEGGGAGPSREPRSDQEQGLRCSWAQKVGLSFASVVPRQLCYGHCVCGSAPHSS